MSTKKADNKAAQRANRTALKKFPKAAVKKAFVAMADSKNNEDSNRDTRAESALKLCALAHTFATEQDKGVKLDTIVEGWKDNMRPITMELAVAGNKFAELKEAKDDKPASAKLTGYGQNVASIAKGVLEHEIDPAEHDSYRELRKAVEGARQEARRVSDPDAAALSDARAAADEAWKELRTLVFGTNHTVLIQGLAETLKELREQAQASPEAQGEAEATESDDPTEENTAPDDAEQEQQDQQQAA